MIVTKLNNISQNAPFDFSMKTLKYIVVIIFALIIILPNTVTLFSEWSWYTYSSKDGKYIFEEYEPQTLTLKRVDELWKITIKENNLQDTVLYRNFSKDPLKFWLWRSYFTHERYKYPYIELQEGKEN
jgi:hypothetical protein